MTVPERISEIFNFDIFQPFFCQFVNSIINDRLHFLSDVSEKNHFRWFCFNLCFYDFDTDFRQIF